MKTGLLEGFLSRAQLAAELSVSQKTICNYEKAGMPVAVRRGMLRYYDVAAVRRWLMGETQRRRVRRAA